MNDQYFTHVPKPASEHNQVENLAIEVEDAFLKVGDTLWNDNKNTASFGSSIGDLDTWYLREYSPSNGIKLNYTQDLYFPTYSKEASLDLSPATAVSYLNAVVIKNRLNPSQIYKYRQDNVLQDDFDFCFVGRKVVLGKAPTNSESLYISYSGYEPLDVSEGGLDLKYNVLQFKTGTTTVNQFMPVYEANRYKVTGFDFKGACSNNIVKIIHSAPYNLEKYVAIYGASTLERYSISDITITNSYISFNSEDNINQDIKIYVANSNLSELIEGLYRLFYSHNHGEDGGRLLNHSNVTGLFNNTDKLHYSITNKENYDHPQYLNREGYIADTGLYNNAMIGDLLVASTDDSNYYNNLSDDSYRIIFGEYSSGHRVGYSSNADALVIDSLSKNGVKLVSPKDSSILSLNSHVFSDTLDGSYSGVRLGIYPTDLGSESAAVFSIRRLVDNGYGTEQEDSAELQVNSSTFAITKVSDELRLLDDALINFGTSPKVQIVQTTEGLVVQGITKDSTQNLTVSLPMKANNVEIDHLDANSVHITDTQRLVFGTKDSHNNATASEYLSFDTTKSQVVLDTKKPITFKQNGFDSGVELSKTNRIFTSNTQGVNTTNTAEKLDTYVQTNGSMYLIKYNATHSSGSTSLQSVDRADIYANDANFTNINVSYVDGAQHAIKLNGDSHKLFVQRDVEGNTATHIQSAGGLNVVSNYVTSGSNINITYGTVRASAFRSEGGGDSAGFYGNLIVPVGNKLTVNGEALIYSDLTLNNKLSVKGATTLSTVEATTVKGNTLTATENLVTSLITAPLGYDSSIFISSDTVFNNSSTFKQVCSFTANCSFSSTLQANTVNCENLNVATAVSFTKMTANNVIVENSLQFKSMLQTDYNLTSEFAGYVKFQKGLTIDRQGTIQLGSADITSTRNTSGVLITENSIKMGNNSTVRSTKVFSNKGLPTGGNGDVVGGYAFDTALSATDGDTGMFCTDKSTSALVDDLVFCINGEQRGVIPFETLDLSGSISGKEKVLVTAEMIKNQFDSLNGNVLGIVYPIGSVYINAVDNRNPKDILNWSSSVWTRFAVGMTMVGAEGTTNSEKMPAMWNKPNNINLAVETEFGEWTHQLTVDEMPAHSHKAEQAADENYHVRPKAGLYLAGSATTAYVNPADDNAIKTSGGDKGHNNVQPSVVVAMWKRVG